MATCTVANSSSIYCDHGCCGTIQDRTCCEYALSEEIIIVICVVGALFVIAVVVALIVCLTSNNKDRVTPIRQQQRRNLTENAPRRPRREIYPKPPPYSEAPPRYDSLVTPADLRPSPSSTDPILPGTVPTTRRLHIRQNRRQHRNTNRRADVVRNEYPTDAPPPYVSIVNMESPLTQTARYSTGPSTSGYTPVQHNRDHDIGATYIDVVDRTGRGSPHPSLASGRISLATDDREHRLHRTVSERSQYLTPLPTLGGALRIVSSVTPVTIREITVHSQFMQNIDEQPRNMNSQHKNIVQRNTKIPRPVQRVRAEDETKNIQPLDQIPKRARKIKISPMEADLGTAGTSYGSITNARHNNSTESASDKRLTTESTSIGKRTRVLETSNKRRESETIPPIDDNLLLEDLSTNLRPSAAARRDKRRAILVSLRDRRQNVSPTSLE